VTDDAEAAQYYKRMREKTSKTNGEGSETLDLQLMEEVCIQNHSPHICNVLKAEGGFADHGRRRCLACD
jgi:hypothetical protein